MNAVHRSGPADGTYLWQYLLGDNEKGGIAARLVRNFGNYSGRKEIESIVVDDRLDYVYYSDELVGVRTYYADTAKGNTELAHFAKQGFSVDMEGARGNAHDHPDWRRFQAKVMESDGS